jgi:hypothetical protein
MKTVVFAKVIWGAQCGVEREAARVLLHLMPGGRFLDHHDTRR